jgi:S-DNA-T family DNA segregation ATPase FtsK/SpoIIIE
MATSTTSTAGASGASPAGAGPAGIVVHRPVRAHPRPVPAGELAVASPPTVGGTASSLAGWLQYLVPLVGSGGSVAFLFAVPGPRPGWLVALVIGAAVASVVAGLALRLVERRSTRRARRRERARYLGHLDQTALRADQLAAAQLAAAEHVHPDPPLVWATIERTDRLWERRPTDADFLTVRVGRGPVPLATPIRLDRSGDPLAEHDPELLTAARRLVGRATWLPNAPVAIPLRGLAVVAFTGPPDRTRALARAVVCELAAFHAPEDLRLLVASPPAARPAWRWTESLPHHLDAGRAGGRAHPVRGEAHPGGVGPHPVGTRPCLVAIVDTTGHSSVAPSSGPDPAPTPGRAFQGATAGRLLERSAEAGGTVIWLAETVSGEPSELSARVRLDDHGWATLQETTPNGRLVSGIRADTADLDLCETVARHIAPRRLERRETTPARAGPVRLLDLLDLPTGPVDPADPPSGPLDPSSGAAGAPSRRFDPGGLPARSRSRLLQVPVGTTPGGDPLVLDLKEAAEGGIGPHGLLVGATGSGKSELLRTIVAGLAATHPPDQLAFVLVDFKGGAAFADLAPLPHVAGLITNLQSDASMVDRAMAALQGELARRQRLLHRNGNQPDLRAYTDRRALDPRLEPLPELLIVVDEFGELLAARPELLDLFAAIGRVGRSLGMHLLLASQRLDEGRLRGLDSHLRFRICLRTFSATESTAVLGVPDAYHLPSAPGAALLKVDAAPPARFSAALVSTDLEALVGGLMDAGRPVHQVWLRPLAPDVPLDPLLRSGALGWLEVPVGVVDRPLEQEQGPLVLDLSGGAGHLAVVGAPRTGKSTLLGTIVAALAATHPPDEVQVYAVDLGGGLLHRLGDLPHVGAVCGPREAERVRRLVRELRSLVLERERRFRDLGVDSMASWHALRRAGLDLGGYGEVFLVVDNWGALVREQPELEAELTELAGLGLHYGVHLVLAANRWAELRPALRENLGGRLELRLNDPLESEVGRTAAASLPELPGRGLTQSGLQFQAALPGQARAILDRALPGRDGAVAPPLRLLPTLVGEGALAAAGQGTPAAGQGTPAVDQGTPAVDQGTPAGLPFAVEEHRLEVVRLDLFEGSPHLLVLGDGGCGKTSLLRLVANGLAARHPPDEVALVVVDLRRGLLDLAALPNLVGYACSTTTVAQAVDHLRRELEERSAAGIDLLPIPPMAGRAPDGVGPSIPAGRGALAPAGLSVPDDVGSLVAAASVGPGGAPVGPGGAPVGPGGSSGLVAGPGPGAAPSPVGRPVGPRHVVLVDDYDLLPAAGGSPLLPLLDLLGLGRELGLHLVLTRRVAGAARAAFEQVFQRLRELGGSGLVMSGDPGEGPLLGGQRAAALPPGRGFLVRPPRPPTLVQVAYRPPPAASHPARGCGTWGG